MKSEHGLCEKISHSPGVHIRSAHNVAVEGYLNDGPSDNSGEIDIVLHLDVHEMCKHGNGDKTTTYIPVFISDSQAVSMIQDIMLTLMHDEVLGLTAMLAVMANTMEVHLAALEERTSG